MKSSAIVKAVVVVATIVVALLHICQNAGDETKMNNLHNAINRRLREGHSINSVGQIQQTAGQVESMTSNSWLNSVGRIQHTAGQVESKVANSWHGLWKQSHPADDVSGVDVGDSTDRSVNADEHEAEVKDEGKTKVRGNEERADDVISTDDADKTRQLSKADEKESVDDGSGADDVGKTKQGPQAGEQKAASKDEGKAKARGRKEREKGSSNDISSTSAADKHEDKVKNEDKAKARRKKERVADGSGADNVDRTLQASISIVEKQSAESKDEGSLTCPERQKKGMDDWLLLACQRQLVQTVTIEMKIISWILRNVLLRLWPFVEMTWWQFRMAFRHLFNKWRDWTYNLVQPMLLIVPAVACVAAIEARFARSFDHFMCVVKVGVLSIIGLIIFIAGVSLLIGVLAAICVVCLGALALLISLLVFLACVIILVAPVILFLGVAIIELCVIIAIFPILAKLKVAHVNYAIMFCLGDVGFSWFMFPIYLGFTVKKVVNAIYLGCCAEEVADKLNEQVELPVVKLKLPFTEAEGVTLSEIWNLNTLLGLAIAVFSNVSRSGVLLVCVCGYIVFAQIVEICVLAYWSLAKKDSGRMAQSKLCFLALQDFPQFLFCMYLIFVDSSSDQYDYYSVMQAFGTLCESSVKMIGIVCKAPMRWDSVPQQPPEDLSRSFE